MTNATLDSLLDLIDERLAEIDAFAVDPDPERHQPAELELPATVDASPADLVRANELLRDLRAAEARITGLRRRIAGEIAGLRRPTRGRKFTAPRMVDTTA
jgi:hypothetical protein